MLEGFDRNVASFYLVSLVMLKGTYCCTYAVYSSFERLSFLQHGG